MKVSTETIVRSIIFLLSIINQILIATGHNVLPFESEELANWVGTAINICVAVWAWWKNNSFTKPALIGDAVMEEEKLRKKQEKIENEE